MTGIEPRVLSLGSGDRPHTRRRRGASTLADRLGLTRRGASPMFLTVTTFRATLLLAFALMRTTLCPLTGERPQ